MVFAGRIPEQKELDRLYSSYPVHEGLNPVTRKRYAELLSELDDFRQLNRILDAGCGSGFFLDEAQKNGWKAFGSEYDPVTVEQCRDRGMIMCSGQLEENSFPKNNFDVITSFEVIEHLADPLKELKLFHRFLRPGGILYLTTPNFNSIGKTIAGSDWSVVNYPEHLNYFTPATLHKALGIAGFQVRSSRTTGISISRILHGRSKNHENEANVNPQNTDQRIRGSIENNFLLRSLRSVTNAILSATGKGDSLKICCTKPQ